MAGVQRMACNWLPPPGVLSLPGFDLQVLVSRALADQCGAELQSSQQRLPASGYGSKPKGSWLVQPTWGLSWTGWPTADWIEQGDCCCIAASQGLMNHLTATFLH